MSTAVVVTKQYIEEREGCYRIVGKRREKTEALGHTENSAS